MKSTEAEKLLEELDDLGEGPLTLGVFCTECGTQYELLRESVEMAWITRCSFIEYLKYIQSLKCIKCEKDED